jgi:hypothetical protein
VSGLNALAIFFFFPETLYNRKSNSNPEPMVAGLSEKGENKSAIQEVHDASSPVPQLVEFPSGKKNTYLQELKPWSTIKPDASLITLFLRPWPCILYPAVIYTLLLYSAILAWVVCVVNTNAALFQSPPYNMSPGINSLLKIPSLIGILVGVICGGLVTDKYGAWRARKNNGIFEPEVRLEVLVLPFLIVPAGLLMFFHHYSPTYFVGTDLEHYINRHGHCYLQDTVSLDLEQELYLMSCSPTVISSVCFRLTKI